jgi:putative transposase
MQQLAESYPVQVICRVWEIPRSTYYYRSQASDEHELRAALQRLAGQWPRYGSRRLTAQLQREDFQVNRKHVQRLMRELGVQGHTYAKKRRTTNSEHSFPRYPNLVEQLEVMRPEQVWVGDITSMRLRKEEEVDLSEYKDDTDAVRQPGRFLDEVYLLQQHSFLAGLSHPSRV